MTTTTYRRDTEHGPALHTLTVDDRGNTTMTATEARALLRLARYSPAPDIDQANAEQAAHLGRYYA